MTYTDYLQRREFDDHLAFQITEPIKELITVSDHALNAQITMLERIEAAQTQAAYEVVCAVRDLQEATERGFRQVGSILEWGFSAMLLQLGRINDQLSAIRNLLENPSLTWAYEQFNRARDLYRREHFPEALQAVDRAINGHANDLGERTEHRFHQLRGVLRLGSFQNNSSEMIDLAEAERDFLLASKYASHDFPTEAGDALMCAAHAANHQGHYSDAASHAERGLRFRKTAGLHYEYARSLLPLKRSDEARDQLLWAIRLDKNLLLKASGDPAFGVYPSFLEEALASFLCELRALGQAAQKSLQGELSSADTTSFRSAVTGQVYRMSDGCVDFIARAHAAVGELASRQQTGGILDLRAALEQAYDSYIELMEADSDFRRFVSEALSHGARELDKSTDLQIMGRRESRAQLDGLRNATPFLVGISLGMWYAFSWIRHGTFSGFIEGVIGGPIVALVVGWLTSVILKASKSSWESQNQAILAGSQKIQNAIREEARAASDRVFFVLRSKPGEVIPAWARPISQSTPPEFLGPDT